MLGIWSSGFWGMEKRPFPYFFPKKGIFTMGSAKYFDVEECFANLNKGFDNLLAFAKLATQAERLHGLAWYAQEYSNALEIAQRYGLDIETTVKVIAALSPQLDYTFNLLVAEIAIRYYVSGGFVPSIEDYRQKKSSLLDLSKDIPLRIPANVTGANLLKALWILQGYDALSGQKVTAFADNLLRFADSSKVTVDSHAILAWFGIVKPLSAAIAPSYYAIVEADYKRLATVLGVSPLESQAIVWVVRRRLSGSDKRDSRKSHIEKLQAFLAAM